MDQECADFYCFILPGGDKFPCPERDGEIDFPWAKALEFIAMARSVFSSHQIDNASCCLMCKELTRRFEKGERGERGLDFMYEVASYAEALRKHWDMDKK